MLRGFHTHNSDTYSTLGVALIFALGIILALLVRPTATAASSPTALATPHSPGKTAYCLKTVPS